MQTFIITTEAELRESFWESHPQFENERVMDCTPHVERERRNYQIEEARRDIAAYVEMRAELGFDSTPRAETFTAKMIAPLERKIADLTAANA